MIFYFTGTGNSQYVAQSLAREGEQVISIGECLRNGRFAFDVLGFEPVGIVCPVYFGGLPMAVVQFLDKLELSEQPDYFYGVLTYGGFSAGAGNMLRGRVRKRGYRIDAVYSVRMPENYVMLYEIPTEEEQEKTLAEAEPVIGQIREQISRREKVFAGTSVHGRLLTGTLYPMYVKGRKTKDFYADDSCVGCGACAGRCPNKAIVMENGRPKWIRERCSFCMSCVRCGAIQYGDKLTGKARYKHPMLRKKKENHCH